MKRVFSFALQVKSQFVSPVVPTQQEPRPITPSLEKSGDIRYNKEVIAMSNRASKYRRSKRSKVANEEAMENSTTTMLLRPGDEINDVNEKKFVAVAESSSTKLENGMPKMQGKNWTLKTFLATRLLDGYNVFYKSSIETHVLHGVIKDGGISCLCELCHGSKIITPCQFEFHACNQRRCPQHYIRLENGTSLRQLLIVCQNTSLEGLVDTIHSLIDHQSVKKSILCNARYFKPVVVCNSPAYNNIEKIRKIIKNNLAMSKVVFGEGGLPNGTIVGYFSHGKNLLEGYKIGHGIFCCCCSSEISASKFEAHAGWATHRKPYHHIYTSNGVSLHEFAISILLKGCASHASILSDKWLGNYCQDNANAVAAGRVDGVDPIDQIMKRCIRMVKTAEETLSVACLLCRGYDFSLSEFGPRTVIICDQCENEYHIGCLKMHKMAYLKELPEGKWFCSDDCDRVHSVLQNFVSHGEEKISDSLLDMMKKKHVNESPCDFSNFDMRWRILSGKSASSETKSLLAKSVVILHRCFNPIVDEETGRDLIPPMVYGRSVRGQDFGGMYCAVLTVNSTVVSVGIFRVFGHEIAELPLVATDKAHRGKGYFKILLSCIEKLLSSLDVMKLVVPAAAEAMSIWTDKSNFDRIPSDQLSKYMEKCLSMLTFKGTTMLHKSIAPQGRMSEHQDS